MHVFTPKCKVQFNLSCFTDCTKHLSAGAPIHRRFIGFLHKQNQAASTDINLAIVTYWALMKRHALLTI